MDRHSCLIILSITLVLFALTSNRAVACSSEEKSNAALFEESVAVVHGKIVSSRVVKISELGTPCDETLCDILELEIETIEAFKPIPDGLSKIYAPVPDVCAFWTLTGWEYIFFLMKNNHFGGAIILNAYSRPFENRGEPVLPKEQQLITDLRKLGSALTSPQKQ